MLKKRFHPKMSVTMPSVRNAPAGMTNHVSHRPAPEKKRKISPIIDEEDPEDAGHDEVARGDDPEVHQEKERAGHDHGDADEVGPPEEESELGFLSTPFHIRRRAPCGSPG